jgi:hypothetical protein
MAASTMTQRAVINAINLSPANILVQDMLQICHNNCGRQSVDSAYFSVIGCEAGRGQFHNSL